MPLGTGRPSLTGTCGSAREGPPVVACASGDCRRSRIASPLRPTEPRPDRVDAPTGSPSRAQFVRVLTVCALGFAALTTWVVSAQGHVAVDRNIAVSVAEHRSAWVTSIMSVVTRLGSGPAAGLVLLALAGWALRRRDAGPFLRVAVAVAAATLSSQAFKHAVDRPRPGRAFALEHLASASFPSGHATMAAALWGSLALVIWGRLPGPRAARPLAGGWAVITAAVAASRVELGVHWTTDVIAGVLLGTACAAATAVLLGTGDGSSEGTGSSRASAATNHTSDDGHQRGQAVSRPGPVSRSPSVGARPSADGRRHLG